MMTHIIIQMSFVLVGLWVIIVAADIEDLREALILHITGMMLVILSVAKLLI